MERAIGIATLAGFGLLATVWVYVAVHTVPFSPHLPLEYPAAVHDYQVHYPNWHA